MSVLAILIYSKLYPIEYFGVWAMFMAFIMIGKTIANGGFHVSLMLPKEEAKATDLVAICYKFNWLTIFVSLAAVFVLDYFSPQMIPASQYLLFIIGIPASVFFEGKAQVGHNWLNREMKYKEMSWGTVIQTLVTVLLSIILGFVGLEINGLILATLVGQFALMIAMLYFAKLPFFLSRPKEKLWNAYREYKSFMTLGVSGNLVNNCASQLPFIFFLSSFGEVMNGHFSMAQQRILAAPTNLVSAAVSPVFFKEANKAHLAQDGSLRKLVSQVNWVMWAIIVTPIIIILLWGPAIFSFALGAEWSIAGQYAQWLAPLMGVRFVTHPLSYLIDVKQRLKAQLGFNLILLCTTIVIFYQPILELGHFQTIQVFGVVFFILQIFFLIYLYSLRKDEV